MALFDAHKNFAASTVATAPSPATSGLSLTVATGEGARFPTPPFNLVAFPTTATYATMAAVAEIVRITAIAGDVLTIPAGGRAQEGTSAKSIAVGWNVGAAVTLRGYADIELAAENASPAFPSAQFYGHSFFFGAGGPASKYGMVQRTARELGISFDGQALSGGVVVGPASLGGPAAMMQNPDFATDLVRGQYQTPGGLKLAMMGFNDYTGFQALTSGNAQVENALTVAYSRILAARVIKPLKIGAAGIGMALETADVTHNGTWAANADVTVSEGLGYSATTTVNDSCDFALDSLYGGEALCFFFPLIGNVCRFTAEIRLDPAGANTLLGSKDFTQWQANLVTAGLGGSIQCIRIPAGTVTAGTHVVRVKITAITASNAGVVGGLIIEGSAPLIVPTAPVFPTSASLTTQAAWDAARSVAAAAVFPSAVTVSMTPALAPNAASYTTNAPGDAPADADLAAWWSSTQAGHPNVKGYARCAQLVLEAAKDVTLPTLSVMNQYQPSPRALAKWMKPNQGWSMSANKGVSENYNREDAAATLALITAKVYGLGGFTIPAGKIVSGLELLATVAGTTITARWVGLCRLSDRVVIAVSLNSTAVFTVGESPQWFTKPYMASDDVDVYALLGIAATTPPTLQSKTANTTQQARAPIMAGVSTTAASATPPTAEVLAATGLTAVAGTVMGPFTSLTLASTPHATLLG